MSSTPALRTPKVEHIEDQTEKATALRGQATVPQDHENLPASAFICQKEIEDDLITSSMAMNDHKRKLEELQHKRLHIQQELTDLQASKARDAGDVSTSYDRESILKKIEGRSETAAAVVCKLVETSFALRPKDVLGVVALLGSVYNTDLSRMLARYLGEEQMLMIVCRNYAAMHRLQANNLRQANNEYQAIFLEDIRPRFIEPSKDSQQLLPLEAPTLPNGNVLCGFLGHAVNLVVIEGRHLQWQSESGHGLRETLFYRLFGDLQVYRDAESMASARSWIQDGALSLDGGIIRGNGVISLGYREPPEIQFTVKNLPPSAKSLGRLHLLMEIEVEMNDVNKQIEEANDGLKQATEKFLIARDKLNNLSRNE